MDVEPAGGLAQVAVTGEEALQCVHQFAVVLLVVGDEFAQRFAIEALGLRVVAQHGEQLVEAQIAEVGDRRGLPLLAHAPALARLLLAGHPIAGPDRGATDADDQTRLGVDLQEVVGELGGHRLEFPCALGVGQRPEEQQSLLAATVGQVDPLFFGKAQQRPGPIGNAPALNHPRGMGLGQIVVQRPAPLDPCLLVHDGGCQQLVEKGGAHALFGDVDGVLFCPFQGHGGRALRDCDLFHRIDLVACIAGRPQHDDVAADGVAGVDRRHDHFGVVFGHRAAFHGQRAHGAAELVRGLACRPTAQRHDVGQGRGDGLPARLRVPFQAAFTRGVAVFAQNQQRLLGKDGDVARNVVETAAVQRDLVQLALQLAGPLGDVPGPVDDEADNGALHLDDLCVLRQLKERRLRGGRGAHGRVGDRAEHGNGRDPRIAQAGDDPLQPHLRVQAAQVVHVDEGQLVAVQLGEGGRARAQAARPGDRSPQMFRAGEQFGVRRHGKPVDVFDRGGARVHFAQPYQCVDEMAPSMNAGNGQRFGWSKCNGLGKKRPKPGSVAGDWAK